MRAVRAKPWLPTEVVLRLIVRFIRLESFSGIVLLLCAVAALVWVNSPWAASYFALWQTPIALKVGEFVLEKPLLLWINEGLMMLFFFVVGLEIKRELLVGALASAKKALLPLTAAVGGMLVPALIYVLLNAGTPGIRGWGIPMATDIAFSLGVLTLLGARAPLSLKAFLIAFAIADDMGAVLVIALFYTEGVAASYLLVGAGLLLLSVIMGALGVRRSLAYALLGIALWFVFLKSGVHTSVAGVMLAMTIPARVQIHPRLFVSVGRKILQEFKRVSASENRMMMNAEQQAAIQALELTCKQVESPLQRLERALHPWVAFGIMPLFALANAGVAINAGALEAELHPVSLGIVLGLVLGKSVGITLFSWLAVRLGLAALPSGVTWRHIYGVGWLGGIGFTMSLFIAQLAFPGGELLSLAKVGILTGSLISGVGGWLILRGARVSAVSPAGEDH
jgi:NhaA family Na+:H+ antiporter